MCVCINHDKMTQSLLQSLIRSNKWRNVPVSIIHMNIENISMEYSQSHKTL